jgi:hypothetical protein
VADGDFHFRILVGCWRCVGQLKGLCAGFEKPQENSAERAKKDFPPENGKRLDTFAKIQTGG